MECFGAATALLVSSQAFSLQGFGTRHQLRSLLTTLDYVHLFYPEYYPKQPPALDL